MKGKELIAQNHTTNQKIVERFMEDGTRFIKHTPFSPAIIIQLKKQFVNKNVEIKLGENKWIRIKKTGDNPGLKQLAEKIQGAKELTHDDIMKLESELLSKAGFIVQVRDI